MSILDYRLCENMPNPCWVRFNKQVFVVSQEQADERLEYLVVGVAPKDDEIVLMSPSVSASCFVSGSDTAGAVWGLKELLDGEAEWSQDRRHWTRVGFLITRGQLRSDGAWREVE